MGTAFLLIKAFFVFAYWLPAQLIYRAVNNFRLTSKWSLMGMLYALWLVVFTVGNSSLVAGTTAAPVMAFLAFWLFGIAFWCPWSLKESDEAKLAHFDAKTNRKLNRIAKREARKAGVVFDTEVTSGKYSPAQIAARIENMMVASGFYKNEDQEKYPGYYVEDYYRVVSIESNGDIAVELTTPAGKKTSDMDRFAELLSAALDYHSAERYYETGDTAGVAKFKVYAQEPENNLYDFSSTIVGEGRFPAENYIDIDAPVDLRSIEVGMIQEKGAGKLTLDLFQNHYLIGGTSGGGKSVLGAIITCQVAKTPAIMYGIDLKQVELGTFSDRFAEIAESHEEADILLDMIIDEMHRRNTYLRATGSVKMKINDPKHPPIVLIVDELAELLTPNGSTKEAKDLVAQLDKKLRSISQLSRSASISLVILTQSPKADIVNTQLRNNLQNRIGLYTKDSIQLQTIIGEDANSLPLIPQVEQAGYFIGGSYIEPVKFKAIFIEESDRAKWTRKYKGNRNELSNRKLAEFHEAQWIRLTSRIGLSDAGIGKMVRTKEMAKLATELDIYDLEIVFDLTVDSEVFAKDFAKHYGGYDALDDFVQAAEKRLMLKK